MHAKLVLKNKLVIILIPQPPWSNTSSTNFFLTLTRITSMRGFIATKVTIVFGYGRWLGLGSGLSRVSMYYLKLKAKWKSCPIVKVCLLSNNCWPIFGRILIWIFDRIGFSRIEIFFIILKLVFFVLVPLGRRLSTSYNHKGGSIS
jgi:hypothetical protein